MQRNHLLFRTSIIPWLILESLIILLCKLRFFMSYYTFNHFSAEMELQINIFYYFYIALISFIQVQYQILSDNIRQCNIESSRTMPEIILLLTNEQCIHYLIKKHSQLWIKFSFHRPKNCFLQLLYFMLSFFNNCYVIF